MRPATTGAASHSSHDVRLVPPIYVKPFVKRQKNDAADAAAIAEVVLRPNMHCVAVKSADHQARAVTFRTHQCLVRNRDFPYTLSPAFWRMTFVSRQC